MRKYLIASLIIGSMGLMGCDRTVSEKSSTTTTPNGSQTTSDQKTVQHPDGSVTTEKQTEKTPGQ
jgi:hypothetical protein